MIRFATIADTILMEVALSQSLKACNCLLNNTILLLLLEAHVRMGHLLHIIAKQMNIITSSVVAAILLHKHERRDVIDRNAQWP